MRQHSQRRRVRAAKQNNIRSVWLSGCESASQGCSSLRLMSLLYIVLTYIHDVHAHAPPRRVRARTRVRSLRRAVCRIRRILLPQRLGHRQAVWS